MSKNKVVSFHDEPPSAESANKYKEALNRAKQNQKDRPTDLSGTPRFDQTTAWSDKTDSSAEGFLSPQTKQGLETLARQAKADQIAANQSGPESTTTTGTAPEFEELQAAVEDKPEKTQEEKLKEVIESRLDSIDVGEYLMSGEVRQEVPIIPGKLEIVFRTVTDLEESFVDNKISQQPSNLTNRQFLRLMNELALVIHIYSVNGTKWPGLVNGDGNINDSSVEARLKHIKKLSSPVFNMLTQNLSWFIERVNSSLTASALGNG